MYKLATWNVNSLKVRLEQVLNWLNTTGVNVLALQETKMIDADFPAAVFKDLGYFVHYIGQKTYNGVAIISRKPQTDVLTELPDFLDPQRRLLAVTIDDIRFINVYVPNGALVGSEKYTYKLQWLEKLTQFVAQQLTRHPKLVIMGDFNIAPEDIDVHDPAEWEGSVLVSPLERQAFINLLNLNLKDSFRLFPQQEQSFSWWDYRAASFRRNRGLRIDHILLSADLITHCAHVEIDVNPRGHERPSDHTPVVCSLSLM